MNKILDPKKGRRERQRWKRVETWATFTLAHEEQNRERMPLCHNFVMLERVPKSFSFINLKSKNKPKKTLLIFGY